MRLPMRGQRLFIMPPGNRLGKLSLDTFPRSSETLGTRRNGEGAVPKHRPFSVWLVGYLPSPLNIDAMRSRFSWEMDSSGMPFGQTAAHSPMLVQLPKPSSSCAATIDFTRR